MPALTAHVGGRRLDRDAILGWEDTRIRAAARAPGVAAPRGSGTATRREALVHVKLDLGPEELLRRLATDVRRADRIARLQACPVRCRRRSATSRFTVDYGDVRTLRTPCDPGFDHQIAGVARASDGTPIGGVRHQFRDTREGLHARLVVEFPLTTLPTMVAAHRWHLACEFANWIEAAVAA